MAQQAINDTGRMAHAYILSSPDRDEALRLARVMAAAAVCEKGGAEPCGLCRPCRKAQAGIHPDIITVRRLADDKGRQKREITVDQIRQVSMDAIVLPNEAGRKVYIIEEADAMNVPAQNAALKLLEEPPAGALFLLTAANPGQLLPTVRSRCAELKLNGEQSEADEVSAALAREYIKAVANRDPARLYAWCAKNEGLDTASAAAFLSCAGELAADMLCGRASRRGMSAGELLDLSQLLERCGRYLRVNVGVKHIFGLLAVDSIAGSGNRGLEF